MLWLVSRCNSKALCIHRSGCLGVVGPRVHEDRLWVCDTELGHRLGMHSSGYG